MKMREALSSAVAAATAFSPGLIPPLPYDTQGEGGSCCHRTPRRASPAVGVSAAGALECGREAAAFSPPSGIGRPRTLALRLFACLAALAVVYPGTTAMCDPRPSAGARRVRENGNSEFRIQNYELSPKGARENLDSQPQDAREGQSSAPKAFPTAQELVSEFLFSGKGNPPSPSGGAPEPNYSIDLMIATAPDPISSRLPRFFDSFIESVESAAEASGYTLDRFALPWVEKGEDTRSDIPSWRRTLYEAAPGLMLFRDPQDRKLLLVFLVGETPTTGIHKQALFSALEQMAQFYPWDPKHAELPAGFPVVAPGSSPAGGATFRIMGPSFSGSAASLRFVLDKWSASRGNPSNLGFRVLSGSATAIDAGWLSQAAQGRTSFQATVPADSETLHSIACYIDRLGYPKFAVLTEGNTAYGQNFTKQTAPGKLSAGPNDGECGKGQGPPEILSLPFPLHISRLRVAAGKASLAQDQSRADSGNSNPAPAPQTPERTAEPRGDLPSISDLTVQSAQLTLSNLISTIAREQYSYVGIVATDVRDVTFLASEVRRHAPATILFTLNSDLLYAYPDVNGATRGMIVITPYPLFNLEQLWTYAYGGGKSRLQFSNQAAEGVYNATLALLLQDSKLVDYGSPLALPAESQPTGPPKPSLWVTAIGNGETLPVGLLDWKDDTHYTYSPALPASARERTRKPSVGRGIYAENSVVAVMVLSLWLAAFSVLIVGQYGRPGKSGSTWSSWILGEPVSPAYRSECHLFLLLCSMSMLAFYFVVAADFCLPFLTGRELHSGIQTTATPKVASVIAIITVLVILAATLTLVFALVRAPSGQRGSAPEVIIFSLSGSALVLTLLVLLVKTWVDSVGANPASGLFTHLRSFDLGGGLSPLLPLACVALGACLWALCSYRRMRLVDVLRAAGTGEEPLSFLSLVEPSFTGVRELENSLKHHLESSTVLSLAEYATLIAGALLVWLYFFYHHLVRALEPRSFYWLFGAAFFFVYWALLMEYLRLVFAWGSLHQLLERLSGHPMIDAFRRYRESHPHLAKMNLTHPPASFAVLESSVNQAGRLIRTARDLAQQPGLDQKLRDTFGQSLPQWEAEVQDAASHVCEALHVQWTDGAEAKSPEPEHRKSRKPRRGRIERNWRQFLISRCHAHRALFRLAESLGKAAEGYWSSMQTEGAPTASAPATKEFFNQVEEFLVSRFVNLLAIVFPSLQNLGFFVLAGLLLMLLAVTSYPFQPRNEFLFFNWVVILSFIGTVFWIFVQMDRDTVLSLLNDTKPGQIHISRELVVRILLYAAVPLLALLGAQFPQSLGQILSVFTAGQGSP